MIWISLPTALKILPQTFGGISRPLSSPRRRRPSAAPARRRPRPQRNPGSRSGRAGARRRTASLFAIQFRASDFCFVICGLSRGDPRSGAIDPADFPNPCYRCSWFSKKAARRGRKRGGHGLRDGSCEAGAAQSSWRGVAAARLRSSRAPAPAAEAESERRAARNLAM